MSEEDFDELNGIVPTQTSGTSDAEAELAKFAARAEYSRVQASDRTVSRASPIRICWRSLAPTRTTTAAGFSAAMISAMLPGQSK